MRHFDKTEKLSLLFLSEPNPWKFKQVNPSHTFTYVIDKCIKHELQMSRRKTSQQHFSNSGCCFLFGPDGKIIPLCKTAALRVLFSGFFSQDK